MNMIRSRERHRPFAIRLRGGIGNQLFIYAAAKYFEVSNKMFAILDDSGVDHGLSLVNLCEKTDWINSASANARLVRRWIVRIFRFNKSIVDLDHLTNFSNLALRIPKHSLVSGFFQTDKYFQFLSDKAKNEIRMIFKPSGWAIQTQRDMEDFDVTVIHVRGGDYLKVSELLGSLGAKYYVDAARSLGSTDSTRYFILSDDNEFARKIMKQLPFKSELLLPPEENAISDSLFLMMHANRLIIANSSFSYWGALLNLENKKIAFPYPWFRNSSFSAEAFPKNWNRIESTWI